MPNKADPAANRDSRPHGSQTGSAGALLVPSNSDSGFLAGAHARIALSANATQSVLSGAAIKRPRATPSINPPPASNPFINNPRSTERRAPEGALPPLRIFDRKRR